MRYVQHEPLSYACLPYSACDPSFNIRHELLFKRQIILNRLESAVPKLTNIAQMLFREGGHLLAADPNRIRAVIDAGLDRIIWQPARERRLKPRRRK